MMKTKNVILALAAITAMLCGCRESKVVEIKNPSPLFQMTEEADYTADSTDVMSSVKKWYQKKGEGEKISFAIKNEAGEIKTAQFPTPEVKNEDLTSDTDMPVDAEISVIMVRITHRGEVFFNGLEISPESIIGGVELVRDYFTRPVVVYINADLQAPFSVYLNVKNVLYNYREMVVKEYFKLPYHILAPSNRDKIDDVFKIDTKEYFYDRHKVKAQWAKMNID